jgi:hypothetical protein
VTPTLRAILAALNTHHRKVRRMTSMDELARTRAALLTELMRGRSGRLAEDRAAQFIDEHQTAVKDALAETWTETSTGIRWTRDHFGNAVPAPTCDASANIPGFWGTPVKAGPCVLRHRHDGPWHRDASGMEWAPNVDGQATSDDGLREQYAAAMREHYLIANREEADADGNMPCRCGDWREPGSMGTDEEDWDHHLADAVFAVRDRRMEQLRHERDLAVAHDRQPYPTQWAYDQACAALREQRERAEEAEAAITRVRAKVTDWREWNEEENAWAINDIETAIANTPPPQPEDPAALDGPEPRP